MALGISLGWLTVRDGVETMTWKLVQTQEDADALMASFGDFHDACFKEAHLWTSHWVGSDLSMACSEDLDTRVRFLFQRQVAAPSSIEMLFEQVTRLNLVPSPSGFFSIIFEATLLVTDEGVYWSSEAGWKPSDPERDGSTWISAKSLRWREVDWMGEEFRYGPREEQG